jgi:molybdopterin-biosynthesis enzyme MoeA-like protein
MAMLPAKALLILNPTSGAPGFIVDNVYCLPGVPSILKSMLGELNDKIKGGKKILSKTMNLRTVESEIAESLEKVQNKFKDIEIGSYPFFKQGKVGVSIVIRFTEEDLISICYKDIEDFVKKKKIEII